MRALLLLAVATFISFVTFLSLMSVSYALLLAGIAGTLEVIPMVGPLAGAAVILLVAAFSGYPHLLGLIAFLAVYRVFQDYVLSPYLMSEGVEVHPVLVLLGVIAGERIAGIPGMFFAVPVIAGLRAILARMRKHNREPAEE
jgi:predicted PurR-regulated permease PerM